MISEVGIREEGYNTGKKVNEYQKSTGNKAGDSWCASFVKWVFDKCGVKTTINGWSATAENKNNIIYKSRRFLEEPKVGDVFTIYSISDKRIVHTGFFYRYYNSKIYETVEGNSNDNGSSNGDGVYKRKRSYNTTYSISRWIVN